jgi:hypothetical protein
MAGKKETQQNVNRDNWRKQQFLEKFNAAAAELGASSYHDVESIKFRDSSGSQDYRDFLDELGLLRVREIQGNFQGKAWRLSDNNNNSIILVEHETGLEILYIVGAVASIVGLVPMVVNLWNRMRDHWPPHHERLGLGRTERRRFNNKDQLVEEPAPPIELMMIQYLLGQHEKLNDQVLSLEKEVTKLKTYIKKPTKRKSEKKN